LKVTDKAKRALEIANRLSKSMHYNYVGTEHILAGLLKEGSGVAAEVLTVNGVELSKLLSMIEELISIGADTLVAERDGYSPRAQHILAKSEEEAHRLGYEKVGTEHILLAIIKEGDCAASRLLNTMGVNLQKIFTDVIGTMGEDPAKYREEFAKSRKAA
jgi:ATP-dependent Clp protease ATP-binding subunit ClpC